MCEHLEIKMLYLFKQWTVIQRVQEDKLQLVEPAVCFLSRMAGRRSTHVPIPPGTDRGVHMTMFSNLGGVIVVSKELIQLNWRDRSKSILLVLFAGSYWLLLCYLPPPREDDLREAFPSPPLKQGSLPVIHFWSLLLIFSPEPNLFQAFWYLGSDAKRKERRGKMGVGVAPLFPLCASFRVTPPLSERLEQATQSRAILRALLDWSVRVMWYRGVN